MPPRPNTGSKLIPDIRGTPAEIRFWAKVKKSARCWLWAGRSRERGYGRFVIGGVVYRAHRVAFVWAKGQQPIHDVLHSCDRKHCVRPRHLWDGTNAENSADMVAKGRQARGERNSHAQLTVRDVLRIRKLVAGGLSRGAAARKFGMSKVAISDLVSRKTWRHI